MNTFDDTSRRRYVFAFGVLLVLTTVITSLVAFASPPADESIYLQLRELGMPAVLAGADWLGSTAFIAVLALLLLLGWRCRALVVSAVAALGAALALAVVLRPLVAAPRPFDSSVSGEDSYPTLAVVALTVLAVMVPVALRVLTRSRQLEIGSAVLLWLAVVLVGWQDVHAALRWPLDAVGGALLGAGVAVVALSVVAHPSRLHGSCSDCPWRSEVVSRHPVGAHHGGRSHPLYRAALVWSLLLAAGFGYLALTRGIPRIPESGVMGFGLEVPLNVGLVVLIVIGVLVAARWHLAGAVLVAFAAVLLGYGASVQYTPSVALLIAAAGFLPAFLLWVQWHRVASIRAALSIATVTSIALGGLVYFAGTNYTGYWGPTHPRSATPAPASDVVDWLLSGAVTTTTVVVNAATEDDIGAVRLVVSEETDLSDPVYSGSQPSTSEDHQIVSLTVDGLEPDTDYYYGLELDGELYTGRTGHFRTFPEGPASFTFAAGSCARTGSSGMVFDTIRRAEPLFFINDGDWFYADIADERRDLFRKQYDAVLNAPSQGALYASTPFVYVWDDHDYGGNDADGSSASRPAVMDVYRQYLPHYPLRSEDSPVFQSFTVGDVRFVVTDARSARDPDAEPREMIGPEQREWLFSELAQADDYGLVVWVQGSPWVGKADPTSDTWAGYAEERAIIADKIAELDVDNLLMVSGDAHMLGYDDGTHTDYSESGNAAFPLLHAAALDRKGGIKGGPYTEKPHPGGGQFGLVHIEDDGRSVKVTVEGRNYLDEVVFTHAFTVERG